MDKSFESMNRLNNKQILLYHKNITKLLSLNHEFVTDMSKCDTSADIVDTALNHLNRIANLELILDINDL